MIKGVFGRASEFIKQGHTELIGIIEAYYKRPLKNITVILIKIDRHKNC